MLALGGGLRANHVLRCLDLSVVPGDEEMARVCRDILDSCVRNTEEAERRAQGCGGGSAGSPGEGETEGEADASSQSSLKGTGKGVWAMVETSQLARSIARDDAKKVRRPRVLFDEPAADGGCVGAAQASAGDVPGQVRAATEEWEQLLAQTPAPASAGEAATIADLHPELARKSRALLQTVAAAVARTEDAGALAELLALNDALTDAMARAPGTGARKARGRGGLGLSIPLDGFVHGTGGARAGEGVESEARVEAEVEAETEEPEASTPRIDKGKAKAVEAPPEPEKVLTPTVEFLVGGAESESEDEQGYFPAESGEGEGGTGGADGALPLPSPTDRSRIWVEEEGEVFRKGNVLLSEEDMENDYAGDDLRKEVRCGARLFYSAMVVVGATDVYA
jgi:protein phosphatase 1 regulatory subunit 37